MPLSGSFRVAHEGTVTVLDGRASVFDGPTDVLYLGAGIAASIRGPRPRRGGRGAGRGPVPEPPPAPGRGPGGDPGRGARHPAGAQLRHPGHARRRLVHRLRGDHPGRELVVASGAQARPARPGARIAAGGDLLLRGRAVPGPATRDLPAGRAPDAFGMFATYSSPAGEIDTNAIVRTGDIALVPYGYHGPAVAAPEYDLYYLNVMAGPDPERVWQVTDDPAQAWIRGPLGRRAGRSAAALPARERAGTMTRRHPDDHPANDRRPGARRVPRPPVDRRRRHPGAHHSRRSSASSGTATSPASARR